MLIVFEQHCPLLRSSIILKNSVSLSLIIHLKVTIWPQWPNSKFKIEKKLASKKFNNDDEVKYAVYAYFED